MLCQECSLKSECERTCEDVEAYLKSKRNYKTTYTGKEVSLWAFPEGASEFWNQSRDPFVSTKFLRKEYYPLISAIRELLPNLAITDRQREIIDLYLNNGLSMAAVGRRLGISQQAVSFAIFGHPVQGGGIVRKVKKAIATDERFENYL